MPAILGNFSRNGILFECPVAFSKGERVECIMSVSFLLSREISFGIEVKYCYADHGSHILGLLLIPFQMKPGLMPLLKCTILSCCARAPYEADGSYALRESPMPYKTLLMQENEDVRPQNDYYWDDTVEISAT